MSTSERSAVVDARVGAKGTRIDLDDVCRYFPVGDGVVKALDQVNLHVDESAFFRGSASFWTHGWAP